MTAKSVKTEKYHILKDRQLLKTCLLFLILIVATNLLLQFLLYKTAYLRYFILFTANSAGRLINLAGIKADVNDSNIILKNQTLLVNLECTAIYLMIIYGSFILAYPANLKRKMVGMAFGLPLIFLANLIRLLLIALIFEFRPQYFQYFHDYMWQIGFIILVILLWLVWLEKVVKYETKAAISA